MRQHFHAPGPAPRAYKAPCVTRDCIERVQVHRERCRFKLATLEAVFFGERPATLNAEKVIQIARDGRRDSPAAAKPPAS
jgi:hypothetical protein